MMQFLLLLEQQNSFFRQFTLFHVLIIITDYPNAELKAELSSLVKSLSIAGSLELPCTKICKSHCPCMHIARRQKIK